MESRDKWSWAPEQGMGIMSVDRAEWSKTGSHNQGRLSVRDRTVVIMYVTFPKGAPQPYSGRSGISGETTVTWVHLRLLMQKGGRWFQESTAVKTWGPAIVFFLLIPYWRLKVVNCPPQWDRTSTGYKIGKCTITPKLRILCGVGDTL